MFVPLHVHSQYSVLDASAPVKAIAKQAADMGMPAVALTDHGNLFGAVEFYQACVKQGVKPIIGCELYLAPRSRLERKKERGERAAFHMLLLAKNNTGYHNLCKLSSLGYLEGFYYFPRIDKELVEKHSEGLICLSGCMSSKISHEILNGDEESVQKEVQWHRDVFGEDFYFELQRHQMSDEALQQDGMLQETWLQQQYHDFYAKQQKLNETLVALSKSWDIPLVATNDSHYMSRDDWRAHEILLNVQSGEPCEIWEKDSQGNPKFRVANPKRRTYSTHEVYFKSPEEMQELFADLPEALSNSVKVAEKCCMEFDFNTKHYPVYEPPELTNREYSKEERAKAVEEYLWKLCREGIPYRYTPERLAKVKEVIPDRDPMQVVEERLQYEMSIIAPKDMCDYLLIVWDFIHWAKKNRIPVGPGRGSGAGSIVLYLIGITDIEPLRFRLFFERFINPERLSYPDIDVDICMDNRGRVIQYTLDKYGKQNVAQIITFGTMKAKMAIRDVGRVLSVPLSKVNAIAKLVPDDLNITLEKALEKDVDLMRTYQTDEEAKQVIDNGMRLEGSIRNTGIHAAGIIISGQPLIELIPICNAKDSEIPVTQYSMKPVEQVGMLKVDFLGLKTLTAIQMAVDAIHKAGGPEIDWINLGLEDKNTFDLLNQGKTLGIFQLESSGMQDLAKQLHLDRFEEIIAVTALYRPGPMDMIPSFINRKHGREPIEYDHPWMKEILAETYGIMVYQEQVMQIAQKLANYSLGEGDVLRRAMGKKDMAQMAEQREKFRLGALENDIPEAESMLIFDRMEKFAAYGFNKSHAAAYAYLSYVTAYLKSNYPGHWMAALMTCDSHDLTKVTKFIRESRAIGIEVLPPDVNESGTTFVSTEKGIRFAMSGIKGVGTGVVEAIVEEREKKGPFRSFYDFFQRIDYKRVGKKIIENLVGAGCFDFTGWSRDALMESIDPMYDTAMKDQKEKEQGVISLFDLMGEKTEDQFANEPKVKFPRSKLNILLIEKELLGFFLTGHPMEAFRNILQRLSCVPLRRIEEMDNDAIFRSAFIVETCMVRFSAKSQKKFAILTVSDGMVNYELPIWPDLFEEKKELLQENQLLYAVLRLERNEEGIRLTCKWLDDLTKADEKMILVCDEAYDKAKHQQERFQKMKDKGGKPAQKEEVVEKKPEKLSVALDLTSARHSHVLELKELFAEHRGTSPVEMDFQMGDHTMATLHIDTAWGVELSAKLEKRIQKVTSVLSVTAK